jgi:glycosyltransferase involved in cell wall biosynthesis
VEEVITHEENGLLVDFFDVSGLANTVCSVLADPEAYINLRLKARQTIVEHYDLQRVSLPAQLSLLEESAT